MVACVIASTAAAQEDRACLRESMQWREVAADSGKQLSAAARADRDAIAQRLRSCVEATDTRRRQAALASVEPTADTLAIAFFDIPEYHDEGRLPIGGGRLGPMAYIYASPFLGTFSRKAQIFEHGKPGALAVIVSVERNVSIPNAYRDLGLDNGINCVWLQARSPTPTAPFDAWVTTAPDETACDEKETTTLRGPFAVVEVQEAAFSRPSDYPPVARFAEDVSGRPVLAFKCLNAFCEVRRNHGQAQVRAPRTLPNPIDNTNGLHRVRAVKGWHDEQELALRQAGGDWVSSGVRASIVPDTGILNYDSAAFHDVWIPAANIVIHSPLTSGKYYDWGLRTGQNHVAVKFDTAVRKWIVGIFDTFNAGPIPGTTPPRVTWKMRERMLHKNAAVPLTARFRWTVGDDGIWFPCGNSCCRSDGEIY